MKSPESRHLDPLTGDPYFVQPGDDDGEEDKGEQGMNWDLLQTYVAN
jgi:hypothetical protein